MKIHQLFQPPVVRDPFVLTYEIVEGVDPRVEQAIAELSEAMFAAGVRESTIREVVTAAANRNLKPQRPPSRIDMLVVEGKIRDKTKKKEAKRKARELAEQIGDQAPAEEELPPAERIHNALTALLRATLSRFLYDQDTAELEATWSLTNDRLRLPVGGEPRDLQKAVLRHMGNLDLFAQRAHEKAKKSNLLRALQQLAMTSPLRPREERDSESVALVEAIAHHRIWRDVTVGTDKEGHDITKTRPTKLLSEPGVHPNDGLALVKDRRTGHRILIVHFDSIAGQLKAPQFRNKRAAELRELFLSAPGAYKTYCSPRAVRDAFGTGRTWGIDLEVFEELTTPKEDNAGEAIVLGRDERNVQGQLLKNESGNAVANVAADDADAETPANAGDSEVPYGHGIPF